MRFLLISLGIFDKNCCVPFEQKFRGSEKSWLLDDLESGFNILFVGFDEMNVEVGVIFSVDVEAFSMKFSVFSCETLYAVDEFGSIGLVVLGDN